MFRFGDLRSRRALGLTPLIDGLFLVLLFLMLLARPGAPADGPAHVVEIGPYTLRLNGMAMPARPLLVELVRLTESGADPIALRSVDGVGLERLVEVADLFGRAGFERLVLAGPER